MTDHITYVGLDAHKASINVAVILPGGPEAEVDWQEVNEPRSVRRMVRKIEKLSSGEVVAAYEAGPCGYALQRTLESLGLTCQVVAPSLIPMKPGERVKTDRRDARKLASLLKAGLLTEVQPPSPEEESVRDLVRAREDAKQDLLRARHRVSKMLLRNGLVYREGSNWTHRHWVWLKRVRFEQPVAQEVYDNYLFAIEQVQTRLDTLEAALEAVSTTEPYAEPVGWLRCLRGVDTVTAMTVVAELHDFRRFATARQFMSYLGLTPSEHSSSSRVRRGSITKAGNAHVRRVLVEAAWNYRHRPAVGSKLKKRREGQPPQVIAIADRAQSRLYRRYYVLKEGHRKHHNVVTVAIARELAGFIWAILNHRQPA